MQPNQLQFKNNSIVHLTARAYFCYTIRGKTFSRKCCVLINKKFMKIFESSSATKNCCSVIEIGPGNALFDMPVDVPYIHMYKKMDSFVRLGCSK